ncbi:gliding motility protein GldB [Formosa agariphila KMM 3901]|uniref:Gliding motility protein GldB n=1 Tax=Formosa agariphila (strain DSM 15362 / KCTC 12365 / LMG 23005 / KMM 3901 / M-2Alg 35-1) TaxID=1347342 RepID=T2KH24_FORAG|nr:gliding motility lipoprotein GldB [Formosa agariphila]CDF78100.1 gliding motility protein GldB [Formosa agariphila KMM 3901]
MKYLSFFLLIIITAVSCKNDSKVTDEISNIEMPVNIERFDVEFSKATVTDLNGLKATYPFMFSKSYPDAFWMEKIQDTLQQELSEAVVAAFPTTEELEVEITSLFQHLKYHYPEFQAPRVITTTSYVDYRNKVIVTDSIDLIALDTYLGPDHEFYLGVQDYIKSSFNKAFIVVDLAEAYADRYILPTKNKTLLDEMISAGKKLYFKDLMIPFKTDAEKIEYTEEQYQWVVSNEAYIWQYFVDRELLYSTDSKLPGRFINPAPFSKFYLAEIDNASPGGVGAYMGWQIVKAYMENNTNVSFKTMLNMSSEDIFNHSKFKPKK